MKRIYLLSAIYILILLKSKAQTVTDFDGNSYNTVTIGTQTWMKENLKVTHYRNGDSIPFVQDDSVWTFTASGAYCNPQYDSTLVQIYGHLYNWFTVVDSRNLCPSGWHIPSDTEWCILENFIEPNTDSSCNLIGSRGINTGGKVKDTDTVYWNFPNSGATNESGFTALPSGLRVRMVDASIYFPCGSFASFWSNSGFGSQTSIHRGLRNISLSIYRGSASKNNGYSVRCIKDSTTAQINNIDTKENLKIYPNPAKDKITIENTEKQMLSIAIYNLVGNLLLQKKLTYGTNEIDINSILPGIYILKIKDNKRDMQYKLIKI